ncbi:FtsX-like permease family protein [Streptomyces sp. NPDC050400]|uniref:FtsX-like permease family protein n=1 Tax=Streptomyces sp. NPDC050400 TaxID=3365610 RepID=UPI0037893B56
MIALALAVIRERRTALIGSLLALCLGVTLLTTAALTLLTGTTGVPDRYAGTDVFVRTDRGTDSSGQFLERAPFSPERLGELTRRLDGVPGVRTAVPDRSFAAQALVDGRRADRQEEGDRLGHGWSSAALAPYRIAEGLPPRADREVAVDRSLGLRPGARVTLVTATGPAPYTVSGTVDGPGYYVSDHRAAQLAGGARVVGLTTDGPVDADAVRAAAGPGTEVLVGKHRTALAPAADAKTNWIGGQVVSAVAGLATFVTVLMVASTFAFGVSQRRRDIGLLRTVGATPRQVRRLLRAEALAVGAVGAAAGVLLGALAAPALADLLVATGFEPEGFTVRRPPLLFAAVFVVGVLVAVAAVRGAARRAAGIGPLDALREATVDDRPLGRARRTAGLVCTVGGIAAAVASASADPTDMITLALLTAVGLITGLTLLAPAFVPPLVRLVTRPFVRRARGATALLVRETMLTSVRRTASTLAPVLATVAFVVLITGNTRTSADSYESRDVAAVDARAVVVPDGTPGLSDPAAARVTGAALLPTTVHPGPDLTPVQAAGVEPAAFRSAYRRLDVVSGSLADLRGRATVVLSRSVLAALHARQGGTIPLTYEDGTTAAARVVAVLGDRGTPYGVLLSREAVRAHDPSALTTAVYRTGAPPAHAVPGTREISVARYAGRADAEEDRLVEVFTLLLVALSAGCTALAVANTLLMATADRRPDLRVLRLAGASPRQILGAVAAETAVVVALGTLLGCCAALPSLLGIRAGLSGTLGVPVALVVPWQPVVGAVAGCLALALAASVLPARRALPGR